MPSNASSSCAAASAEDAPFVTGTDRVKKSASGSSATLGGGGPARRKRKGDGIFSEMEVRSSEFGVDTWYLERGTWNLVQLLPTGSRRCPTRNLIVFVNFQECKRIAEVPCGGGVLFGGGSVTTRASGRLRRVGAIFLLGG